MKRALEFYGGRLDGETHKVPKDWHYIVRPLGAEFHRCTGLPKTMSIEGARTYVGSSTCGLYALVHDLPNGGARMVCLEP